MKKLLEFSTLAAVLGILFFFGLNLESMNAKLLAIFVLLLVCSAGALLPTRWSFWLLLGYVGFEGLAKIVSNYHPIVHVGLDITITLLCVKTLLQVLLKRIQIPDRPPPLTILFAIHLCWFCISFANPFSMSLIASLASAKMYLTVMLLFFFGYYLTEEEKHIKIPMAIFVTICCIHCLVGMYQANTGPSSVLAIHPGYAKALLKYEGFAFRPFGLTHVAGGPSSYIFLTASFVLYFLFYSRSSLIKATISLLIPLIIVTLFLCQVRAALLKTMLATIAFLLITTPMLLKKSPKKLLAGALGVAVLTGFIMILTPKLLDTAVDQYADNARAVERTMTLFNWESASTARRGLWNQFTKNIAEAPLGAGLSRTGAARGKFSNLTEEDPYFKEGFASDNLWLALMVDVGIPGMIFYTLILLYILYRGFSSLSTLQDPNLRHLNLAILCTLFVSFVGGWGATAMLYNPEAAIFWSFAGMMFKLPELQNIAGGQDEDSSHCI